MATAQQEPDAPVAADAGYPDLAAPAPDEAADRSPTALFSCSLAGTVLTASATLGELAGRPVTEATGAPAHALLHPSSHALLDQVLGATRNGAASGSGPLWLQHADGSGIEVSASWSVLTDSRTHRAQLVFVRAGVADADRWAERELRSAALQDGVTQLANRTLLVDRLAQALGRARYSTAVLLVDLDHFRMVNASRGHRVGDQLLAGVEARVLAAVSPRETVARFGDDEFVVICEDTDEHQAHALARYLLAFVAEPFQIDGAAVHVTASVGVAAAAAEPAVSALDLLRRADTAVHAGKTAGRGRVHLFEQSLGDDVQRRYALAADLRAALADDVLELEYQPIVDLRSGAVVGMEALARWTHPERGPVSPGTFVGVAELTGLAPELDRWVLRRALRDMAALRGAGVVPDDAYVAVNLSAANLTDTSVFDQLPAWTEESGVPAGNVVLEITETAIMENTDLAARLLRGLRDQGFRVAMDDFGTGYSSLAHLRDLPISALKVDRSFVADITEQRDALAIVAWIIDLARAVGVAVVAEGVETEAQAALLQRLDCVTAQGWLWGPAVPVTALLSGRAWVRPLPPGSGTVAGARTTRLGKRGVSVAHGLARLVELYQDGASVAAIAATLDAEGFRTPSGLRWHRTSVARVIAHQIRRGGGQPDSCAGDRRFGGR